MATIARAGNLILVGLEEKNIEKLREGKPFHHHMNEVGSPFQLVIYYGKTYDDLLNIASDMTGPDTQIVDNRNRKKS